MCFGAGRIRCSESMPDREFFREPLHKFAGAQEIIPQGLKPAILLAFSGTSKLVPFQNTPCAELC